MELINEQQLLWQSLDQRQREHRALANWTRKQVPQVQLDETGLFIEFPLGGHLYWNSTQLSVVQQSSFGTGVHETDLQPAWQLHRFNDHPEWEFFGIFNTTSPNYQEAQVYFLSCIVPNVVPCARLRFASAEISLETEYCVQYKPIIDQALLTAMERFSN